MNTQLARPLLRFPVLEPRRKTGGPVRDPTDVSVNRRVRLRIDPPIRREAVWAQDRRAISDAGIDLPRPTQQGRPNGQTPIPLAVGCPSAPGRP